MLVIYPKPSKGHPLYYNTACTTLSSLISAATKEMATMRLLSRSLSSPPRDDMLRADVNVRKGPVIRQERDLLDCYDLVSLIVCSQRAVMRYPTDSLYHIDPSYKPL